MTRERGFILKMSGSHEGIVLLLSVIPTGLNAEELTRIEKFTRGQALSYVESFRRFMPGMENCELTMMGPLIGCNVFLRQLIREKKIPFSIGIPYHEREMVFETGEDDFYSEANMYHLKKSIDQLNKGKVIEHDLIPAD